MTRLPMRVTLRSRRERQALQAQRLRRRWAQLWIGAGVALAMVVACTGFNTVRGAQVPRSAAGLATGAQVARWQGDPACLTLGVPVAAECNERRSLPWCAAPQGDPGVWCFWRDGDGLWFRDGDVSDDLPRYP